MEMSSNSIRRATAVEPTGIVRGCVSWLLEQEETIRRILILTFLYLFPVIWILCPVVSDPDIWWHLQSGKWIVDHGQLPATDPFSAFGDGKPWVAYSWLFEISMYELVHIFGESGIFLYSLLGVWSTMLILHRIIGTRCQDFLVSGILLTLSVVALSKLFTPRPWQLTMIFFAVTLHVVLSLREGRHAGWFWLLPIGYAIWANTHVQFIYGLALLGLACITPLIDRYIRPFSDRQAEMTWGSDHWKRLTILTTLCALATLLTPYHVRLYSVVIELAAQTGMWEYTQEMQAPPFRGIADWAMLALFAAALIQLGWRRTFSSFEIILLFAAALSGFRGQRDVWFLVMACLAVIVSRPASAFSSVTSLVPRHGLVPTVVCVAIGLVGIVGYRDFSESSIRQNTAKLYPIEAASFLEQHGYAGSIYNHFNWGGYLIWRLPSLKVSMDGRANVHGDARIKRSLATWDGRPEWKDDEDLRDAHVVIGELSYPLMSILRLDPRFRVIHEDKTAVIFARVPQIDPSEMSVSGRYNTLASAR